MADPKDTLKGQDWPLLTPKQQGQFETMALVGATAPEDWKVALISNALMLCPLPYRKTDAYQVVRETQIPGGSITAVLSRLDEKILLPYGDDAYVLDLLSTQARFQKSPEISTDNLADLMRLVGMNETGGTDYRRFMARLQRIGAFALRVKRRGHGAVNARVVDADDSAFWSEKDLKKAREGQRRLIPCVLRLSPEFFNDLMHQYAAIPLDVLDAFSGNPTAYATVKWLWWRAGVSRSEGIVSWEELARERGSADTNLRRFKSKTEAVLAILATARPDIARLFHALPAKGLRITPLDSLPPGVEKPVR